ncbi:glycosyltransferase [Novosphingobium sp. KA1]|uniref:glycosyltransferase n=1 Tax=Novosphingobium sp. (strain KA1) TaxID=164608 RepID=UPI001A8C248E|nr:glycosyltransferase [Novosphingobium sp. KA1]
MTESPAANGNTKLPVVILSTADIAAPIWTNKQHIASRLAAERDVHYIESLGLRSPSISAKDLKRVLKRVSAIFSSQKLIENQIIPPRAGVEKIRLYAPLVIPFHAFGTVRAFNHRLIARSILPRLPERYALWSFSPLTYGLEDRAAKVVYHSVDLLHTIPGIPEQALLNGERQLISRADAVIASSKGVAEHLCTQGAQPLLWENVADIELFVQARSVVRERRAIFVGNLTPGKVDFKLLEAIVAKGVRLALAGPSGIDGTRRDAALDRLLQSPLVEYLGVLSQEALAAELGRSWMGIIPYHVNDYTTGVFPMKVYEYLGAGLPVVATPLPSLVDKSIPDLNVVAQSDFADLVAAICTGAQPMLDGDFSGNSWTARLEQICNLLAVDKEIG